MKKWAFGLCPFSNNRASNDARFEGIPVNNNGNNINYNNDNISDDKYIMMIELILG